MVIGDNHSLVRNVCMTTIPRCQAKNGPSSCIDPQCPEKQFHANISRVARDKLAIASDMVTRLVNPDEFLAAQENLAAAQAEYNATREGLENLKDSLEDPNLDSFARTWREYDLENAQIRFDAEYGNGKKTVDPNSLPLIPVGEHTYDVPAFTKEEASANEYYPATTGSKFTGYQNATEIAKKVRADLKEAQEKNYLPQHLSFSVKKDSGAMSSSVTVTVIGIPDEKISDLPGVFGRLTPEAQELRKRVEGITGAYNQSRTNSQLDYFQETYYSRVELENSYSRKWREGLAADAKAKRDRKKALVNVVADAKSLSVSEFAKTYTPKDFAATTDKVDVKWVEGSNVFSVNRGHGEEIYNFDSPRHKKVNWASYFARNPSSAFDRFEAYKIN
jgi:hypothetical protein